MLGVGRTLHYNQELAQAHEDFAFNLTSRVAEPLVCLPARELRVHPTRLMQVAQVQTPGDRTILPMALHHAIDLCPMLATLTFLPLQSLPNTYAFDAVPPGEVADYRCPQPLPRV